MNRYFMDLTTLNGPIPIPDNSKKSCRGGAGSPPSACKRKAEDFPPLMGSSPLMSWSPYVIFMVISSQDNRKMAAKSPFKINRELIRILGAEPHGFTKQYRGDLMVELRSKEQEKKLEDASPFLETPTYVHSAYHTTSTRASTLPRVSSNTTTFRTVRERTLWANFLTSCTPDASMCERETSGFQQIQWS